MGAGWCGGGGGSWGEGGGLGKFETIVMRWLSKGGVVSSWRKLWGEIGFEFKL